MDPDAALLFLDFVRERHRIWEQRQLAAGGNWTTEDPILGSYKFTNVFRVLDFGSQFVFELADDDPSPRDLLMRLFLYRHTGRVEIWRALQAQLGGWPVIEDLDTVLEVWREYRGVAKPSSRLPWSDKANESRRREITVFKRSIFTNAYLVYPQSSEAGTDKLESIVNLTKRLFENELFERFQVGRNQETRFGALRSNKGVADFMSMQILTDWGYVTPGPSDLEDEFVVPGPGALKGAKAIAPSWRAIDVIRWGAESLRADLKTCPLIEPFDDYFRTPSYMDVQNCLCEFSKYVRYMEKPPRNQPYVPAHPGPQPPVRLPAHW